MRNKDTLILENLYSQIYNEMAFGLGAGGTPMSIQQIMDLVVNKNKTEGNREIPFSFTSVTTPKFYKKQCSYQTIYKITQTVASLGSYGRKLNRELEKRGEEPVEVGARKAVENRISRNVGISIKGNPLLLFDITYIQATTSIFVVREQSGEIHKIEKEEAKKLLYPASAPNVVGMKERNYAFSSLVGLKIDKQEIVNTDVPEDKMEVFNYVKSELKS
jgi:hypothetical protein